MKYTVKDFKCGECGSVKSNDGKYDVPKNWVMDGKDAWCGCEVKKGKKGD